MKMAVYRGVLYWDLTMCRRSWANFAIINILFDLLNIIFEGNVQNIY
jgi:hypothetical protein